MSKSRRQEPKRSISDVNERKNESECKQYEIRCSGKETFPVTHNVHTIIATVSSHNVNNTMFFSACNSFPVTHNVHTIIATISSHNVNNTTSFSAFNSKQY